MMIVVAAGLLAAGQVVAKDWTKVRIATDGAYAPWNFTSASGDLIGFELELAEDLCNRMAVQCEIVTHEWESIIAALRGGKFDAIMAGMLITDERKKLIAFSRAYAAPPAAFVVATGSPLAGFTTSVRALTVDEPNGAQKQAIAAIVEQFQGKTIGVEADPKYKKILQVLFANKAAVRTYGTREELNREVKSGGVDAAFGTMGHWVPLLESDDGRELRLVGPSITGGPLGAGVAVGVRKKDKELAERFSKVVAAAIADGTVSSLAIRWFGFDVSPVSDAP